jgi:epoxyqueuosine reductase
MYELLHNEENIVNETENLGAFIRNLGIEIFGIADINQLNNIPIGINDNSFLNKYNYAIVLGIQLRKVGIGVSGNDANILLEKSALDVMAYLEEKGYISLIIHTEDEFDPITRKGLLSLKVLAKEAGLGWQGRSLLIVSPKYGPIHRWIAILTNMYLKPGKAIMNQCDQCRECIEKCPTQALTYVEFDDHPRSREDVLDIRICKGDEGCKVCLLVCPWGKK